MKKVAVGIICIGVMLTSAVNAEERTLSKEEAQALFSNKTFDGVNEIKGKNFKVYSSADGVHTLKKANGQTKEASWRIDNRGRHCVEFSREKCSKVVTEGDGVYKKISYGEHTHTLKNFVDGNQL